MMSRNRQNPSVRKYMVVSHSFYELSVHSTPIEWKVFAESEWTKWL